VGGTPRQQINIVSVHEIWHADGANYRACTRDPLPDQLMQKVHKQTK
jgi:hypothetical protein